ncbi:MAG: competence protein ComK [Erysipelotrichaceae bacterium]
MIYFITKDESEITYIHCKDRIIKHNRGIEQVMDWLCHSNGATLKGQKQGTRDLTKMSKKVPIVLYIEGEECIFFLIRNKDQQWWINSSCVNFYLSIQDRVFIDYSHHQFMYIDASYYSFHQQMNRCSEIKKQLQDTYFLLNF